MVYSSLVRRAAELSSRSLSDIPSKKAREAALPERRRQWREMLGIEPLPERTDLRVTATGRLARGYYVIEKLHFQPVPGCYIAANVYRPKEVTEPLPAVVYVCGHASTGKVNYQAHARWFGTHGYVCLILDTIEIGESTGDHHGVYRQGWWHWYSQGYTPAGLEVWYAMRAADYLQSRDDVDGSRLGITGNSGGGAVSWFTGGADERFTVVAPSCQTGTVEQHIRDRTLDGHCDCAVWGNLYGWDLADVGALIAPRPLFVASATEDSIWRPWSNRELLLRIRRLYRAHGIEDRFDVVEDVAPHGYTPKTRLALFSWFDKHLKGVAEPVTEDIDDEDEAAEDLTVFPDGRPPEDDRTPAVHEFFIPLPEPPEIADRAAFEAHQRTSLARLREVTFRHIPERREVPEYEAIPRGQSGWTTAFTAFEFETEPGLRLRAWLAMPCDGPRPCPALVGPLRAAALTPALAGGTGMGSVSGAAKGSVEVRGTGDTSIGPGLEWFVRRAYPLLGCSLPERRTLDLLRGVDILLEQPAVASVAVYGAAETAPLAIYAALLDPRISEVVLEDPVTTHWDGGPEFLNVLKVGDLPHNAALLFPRRITFVGGIPEAYAHTREVYETCGRAAQVRCVESLGEWEPQP